MIRQYQWILIWLLVQKLVIKNGLVENLNLQQEYYRALGPLDND